MDLPNMKLVKEAIDFGEKLYKDENLLVAILQRLPWYLKHIDAAEYGTFSTLIEKTQREVMFDLAEFLKPDDPLITSRDFVDIFKYRKLENLPEEFKCDKAIVKKTILRRCGSLKDTVFRADVEFVREILQHTPFEYEFVPDEMRRDRDLLISVIKRSGDQLNFALEEYRNDEELVRIAAVRGYSVKGTKFAKNKEFVALSLKGGIKLRDFPHFSDDEEIALAALLEGGTLEEISRRLQTDWAFINKLIDRALVMNAYIQVSPASLTKRMRKSRYLMEKFTTYDYHNFIKVNRRLKNNKEFVLKWGSFNGYLLQYVSERLRDNDMVVLAAMGETPDAIRYASLRHQKDVNLISYAASRGF